jgi:hypothetical protein
VYKIQPQTKDGYIESFQYKMPKKKVKPVRSPRAKLSLRFLPFRAIKRGTRAIQIKNPKLNLGKDKKSKAEERRDKKRG